MWFDYRLKTDSNLRYYRWSYKFDDEVDFTNIAETVTHRYGTFIPTGILAHPVTLGPKTVGATAGLFDIPDPNPGDTGWINGDDRWDAPFAYFDSTGNSYPPFIYTDLAAPPRKSGMCTLKLEMFDAGGNFVPCGNLNPGVFKFVLPDLGTPNTYTTTLTGNNITPAGALVFRVRIDNNDTTAQLNGVTASGLSADDCGILHYTDSSAMVDVRYAATHPNDFLTWGLTISRGLAGVVASGSGATSSPPMSLPPPSTPGSFNNPASALLGPDCVDAAFAVILNCYANATDGYDTQTQYNRSAAIAFALIMP